jgi:hypothetical protein
VFRPDGWNLSQEEHMEVKGSLIRFRVGETLPPRFASLPPERFITEDGWMYLVINPMYFSPFAQFFGSIPTPKPLPPGFEAIFGKRPTSAPQNIQDFWQQQLGLWRDNQPSDSQVGMSPTKLAAIAQVFIHYGLGAGLNYRLTNGGAFVYFPDADKRAGAPELLPPGFVLPATLVYDLPEHGIMLYQAALMLGGVSADKLDLVPYLKNTLGTQAGGGHQS